MWWFWKDCEGSISLIMTYISCNKKKIVSVVALNYSWTSYAMNHHSDNTPLHRYFAEVDDPEA
jgi:hypothetical protein